MADRWTEDRDRQMRERNWRRTSEAGGNRGGDDRYRSPEFRSFDDDNAAYGYDYGRASRDAAPRSHWQDRDYGGVSPAMSQGEYDLGDGRSPRRFQSQDYTRGARSYGSRAYGGDFGTGGPSYGAVPTDYDGSGGRSPARGYDSGYPRRFGGMASGGTGGYDYERGYGGGMDEDRDDHRRSFMYRAGERVASWFGGHHDAAEQSHRGRGPQGYKRADDRISDDAHERLTDDTYLDASNISISVSGGEVTLSGTVESREAKHRAERLVEDISGVSHVQNNLRVARGNPLTTPGRGFGDSVLDAQMRGENPGAGPAPPSHQGGGDFGYAEASTKKPS